MSITPQALFDFALAYSNASESNGRGTMYPTFREVARRFRVRQEQVEQACLDWDQSLGYMQPVVGIQCGSGVGAVERYGDLQVEAYR